MTFRFLTAVVVVLIALGSATQASAECWLTKMCKSVISDIKNRQIWPDQYRPADVEAAKAPFPIMVENGWRRQNMLVSYHFDPATKQLTEAGRIKVQWILKSAPQDHRSIYVHEADTDEETSARVASVQQFASKISPKTLHSIQTTTISEEGSAANQIDVVGRKYMDAIPDPKLPPAQAGVSGGSGGS